jgi:methylthioribose-1-phosphate isomerase
MSRRIFWRYDSAVNYLDRTGMDEKDKFGCAGERESAEQAIKKVAIVGSPPSL